MRWLLFLALAAGAAAQDTPPTSFVSRKACPFECCSYREWIAGKDAPLYSAPNGRRIDTVKKGDHVTGMTGEVHSTPRRWQLKKDDPDTRLRKGTVVYLLHPIGEGFYRVWYRGKTLEFDPLYNGETPPYTWWAQVKTSQGLVAWALMNQAEFSNLDSCG